MKQVIEKRSNSMLPDWNRTKSINSSLINFNTNNNLTS